jgi:hypothetical protein
MLQSILFALRHRRAVLLHRSAGIPKSTPEHTPVLRTPTRRKTDHSNVTGRELYVITHASGSVYSFWRGGGATRAHTHPLKLFREDLGSARGTTIETVHYNSGPQWEIWPRVNALNTLKRACVRMSGPAKKRAGTLIRHPRIRTLYVCQEHCDVAPSCTNA